MTMLAANPLILPGRMLDRARRFAAWLREQFLVERDGHLLYSGVHLASDCGSAPPLCGNCPSVAATMKITFAGGRSVDDQCPPCTQHPKPLDPLPSRFTIPSGDFSGMAFCLPLIPGGGECLYEADVPGPLIQFRTTSPGYMSGHGTIPACTLIADNQSIIRVSVIGGLFDGQARWDITALARMTRYYPPFTPPLGGFGDVAALFQGLMSMADTVCTGSQTAVSASGDCESMRQRDWAWEGASAIITPGGC
jgi:hypothetical protein